MNFFLFFHVSIWILYSVWKLTIPVCRVLVHVAESKYKNQFAMVLNIYSIPLLVVLWSTYASYNRNSHHQFYDIFLYKIYGTKKKKINRTQSCSEIFIFLIFCSLSLSLYISSNVCISYWCLDVQEKCKKSQSQNEYQFFIAIKNKKHDQLLYKLKKKKKKFPVLLDLGKCIYSQLIESNVHWWINAHQGI